MWYLKFINIDDFDQEGIMGKGTIHLLIGLVMIAIFMTVGVLRATETQEIPDEIIIDNKGYNPDRKSPVSFSHGDHAESYDVACAECHHDYENGKNLWKEGDPVNRCIECHSPLKSDDRIKKLSVAFHKNCKGCHKKLAEEGSTEAPYKQCTDCHKRDS